MKQTTPMRAMWLLARLRLQRLSNLFTTIKFGSAKNQKSRSATPAKKRLRWLLPLMMMVSMSFSFLNMEHQAVLNVQCHLEPGSQCVYVTAKKNTYQDFEVAAQELQAAPLSTPVAVALTMQLSLLFLVSFLLPLGSRELAQPDWDLEWLVTLPVRRSTLLWGRIFERTITNVTGLLVLAPTCVMVAWFSGFRWSAPLIGLIGVFALLPLAAVLRTLADTGLRMSLPPSQLRNLQAVAGIISLPFIYLAMAFGMPTASGFVLGLARTFPEWTLWTPPGLVIELINAATPARMLGLLSLLLVQLAVPIWIGMYVLHRQLHNGVVASGSRETARRPVATSDPHQVGTGLSRFLPKSPIKRRELRLLSRDRNFLVQSLLMPVVMVGGQTLLNGSLDSISQLGTNLTLMAAIAFGIGSYMLMLSAFQTLNNEGQVLWMLFTFPRSIESVLKEKAQLWAILALFYPLAIFVAGIWLTPTFNWETLSLFVIVLAGIPIYSFIAVALGVFACDPLAQDVRTKVRPSYLYLYMLLVSLYVYAIYTGIWSQKLVVMVLTASLAQALWQKARDELPYLLDSAAAPPARVSTSDGMMAAMLFFVLQGIALFVLVDQIKAPAGQSVVVAFGIAGTLVYGLMRLVYWTNKTSGVPVMVRGNTSPALRWGIGAGLTATAAGLGYLYLLQYSSLWADIAHANLTGGIKTPWLFALAVVAAPLCEEFIFRGLIFGGMRRSMGVLPAMLMSAALFSIVHPPVSMLPVFVLGLCTAYAYERTKVLLAPMLVHAIYNTAILAYQISLY